MGSVGAMVLAFLLFFVPSTQYLIPVLAMIGSSAAFVPPPIFSLPSKVAKPQNLDLAFGILSTCLNVGVLAGPYAVGLARDLTGGYPLSFYLMALFAALQIPTVLLQPFSRRRT